MAQDQAYIEVGASWVQLTNADATAVTLQCVTGVVYIRGTVTASAPSAALRGILVEDGDGFVGASFATLFPGAAVTRLWARSVRTGITAGVVVSHG